MNATAERMGEQVKFTKELAKECFPNIQYYFKWDNRMTSSAGRIIWHQTWVEIKLSTKIFFQATKDLGIDAACEEIHETILHEIGHAVVGHPGHGTDWSDAVEKMGGHPQLFHNLTAGKDLIPDDLRERFFLGAKIEFKTKTGTVVGTVIKHNVKNMRVRTPSNTQWNIPWAIVGNRAKRV